MISLQFMKRNWKVRHLILLFWITLVRIGLTDAGKLNQVIIRKLVVPPHVEVGDDVVLECDHNVPKDQLFQSRWLFDGIEFFKAEPSKEKGMAKVHHKDAVDIDVDVAASSERKVVLLSIKVSSTGTYTCIVVREKPFKEMQMSANMTVVVIPKTKPKIEPSPSEGLRPGSEVDLNCTAAPSIPAAELEWLVNDEPAPESSLIVYEHEELKDGLMVSRLGLKFELKRSHYQSGELKLKCTAKISTFYTRSQEHLDVKNRTGDQTEVTAESSPGGCECVRSQWLMLLVTILISFHR